MSPCAQLIDPTDLQWCEYVHDELLSSVESDEPGAKLPKLADCQLEMEHEDDGFDMPFKLLEIMTAADSKLE